MSDVVYLVSRRTSRRYNIRRPAVEPAVVLYRNAVELTSARPALGVLWPGLDEALDWSSRSRWQTATV